MSTEPRKNHTEAAHPAMIGAALRGLHDMAQPLTVLQGSLELALMQVQTVDEYRQWLEFALEQAGRLVSNLEYVQQIVGLQQPASDVECFTISALLRTLLEGLRSTFSGQQIGVTVIRRGERDGVRASYGRVQEALRLIFSSLCALLPQGGEILLEIDDRARVGLLHFGVTDKRSQAVALENSSSATSGLHLAQNIVASTGGEMILSLNPLSVALCLPATNARTNHQRARKKGDSVHV